jgi:hypothetical protein
VNIVDCKIDWLMSLRLSDFAAVQRAALCAARVAVGAAVSESRGIWGVSDPLCHPPVEVLRFEKRGRSRHQMHVTFVRRNRACP